MSDDVVNIEVDGKPVVAKKGQMVIAVTDQIGAYIPRFCYHEKLSIAANCRMCLVEIEKAPKPMPACATPVGEGMKIFTRSPKAIAAQKATMEFLLINHPLDCPICDQGGECELQDLAMGYGRDVSRYQDRKRVVKDKDIGPLVSTDMTRCIHCTRCVRFGEEVTGMPQLGTTSRGENMQISTYVEMSIDHELSANIIDLCPVGALNNKPYRYSARAWEMMQHETIAPHDCVGSNMYAHVLRGTVKRIVPRPNEAINETWLSDRDRFSYEGIYSPDRLKKPQLRENGAWRDIEWDAALDKVATVLGAAAPGKTGMLASPVSTLEEAHLLSRLATHLQTANIDHRLSRADFSGQDSDPIFPWLGCDIAALEGQDAVFVAGCNIRHEAPILAHRLRKASLRGAKVSFANRVRYQHHFAVDAYVEGAGLVALLAGVAMAAADGKELPKSVATVCKGIRPSAEQQRVAQSLREGKHSLVLLGNMATRHAAYSVLRALAACIADFTGAKLGNLSEGPNAAGLHLAGVLPHRGQAGKQRNSAGLNASTMLDAELDALLLLNLEPDADVAAAADAVAKIGKQKFVVALTAFDSGSLRACTDLLLPIGTFAETSGTYVNVAGTWQSFAGIASPVGESRPAWKVLRVIGNLLHATGFDYMSGEEVRDELAAQIGAITPDNSLLDTRVHAAANGMDAAIEVDVPLYSVDGLVRRAAALQLTPAARRAAGEGK
ncbi:MAG: NADH-quinone oxidoreductase subunit NuoG [Gammaproteobacteria bacterium]|nr:NADH-quinone oxidoreductase subunit NuoG [Gammaproteobacteria bacterium]MDH5305293.1 NADH-quinone oxidoreductase subunit NuoG [Gammaproteobacteria bacterium]MDH5323368.1 NADH-quinone oxidoreductase subunit NuoG [Gammaproteobacteria bacterium]